MKIRLGQIKLVHSKYKYFSCQNINIFRVFKTLVPRETWNIKGWLCMRIVMAALTLYKFI